MKILAPVRVNGSWKVTVFTVMEPVPVVINIFENPSLSVAIAGAVRSSPPVTVAIPMLRDDVSVCRVMVPVPMIVSALAGRLILSAVRLMFPPDVAVRPVLIVIVAFLRLAEPTVEAALNVVVPVPTV